MVSTHESLFSLIIRVVWFHIFVNSCSVCYVLCVTRYGYCSALTFSSESSFIGTPLNLMCTKVNVCMYLCILGHSQWIRACMRSSKTLCIVAKGMGTAIVNPFGTLIDVWRQQKKQEAKETNRWISGSGGIAGNHFLFFSISLVLNQMYSYVGSL